MVVFPLVARARSAGVRLKCRRTLTFFTKGKTASGDINVAAFLSSNSLCTWNAIHLYMDKGFDLSAMRLLESALQKFIRRGEAERAMYVAWRLCRMSPAVCWSRLLVISNEDVARAPEISAVDALRRQFAERVGKKEPDDDALRMAMVAAKMLAEVPKDRRGDEMLHLVEAAGEGVPEAEAWLAELSEVPDYVKDVHTKEGAEIGRTHGSAKGEEHWLDEGSYCAVMSDGYAVWRPRWLAVMRARLRHAKL